MTKKKSMLSMILPLVLAMGGVGCSTNSPVKHDSVANKTVSTVTIAKMESNNKADKSLIDAAIKALAKENKAELIAKKKVWIAKRRKQHAEKKQQLLKLKQQQLALNKKRLSSRQKYNSKSISPKIRKVVWRTNKSYSLTGDFSRNASAKAFIKHMSRSYNMDRSYLNRIFSEAQNLKRVSRSVSPPQKRKQRKKSKSYGRMGRWTRYRQYFITPRHINGGVKFWREHAATLNRAYQQYGVPPEYIVAVLGVETIYGGNVGKTRVLDSLSTKAFHKGRRKKFFRNELEKYLLMAQSEGLNPIAIMGSSAGAVGLCQFMPSNFKTLGVDYNRDGTCNLWDPVDAIGSIANYFSKHGWKRGGPVAVRAIVQGKSHRKLRSGYKRKYSLSRLANKGVRPHGRMDSTVRFLRMNTNAGDEVWLGGHNFYVITRYNHSGMYALAVHQLAQEVKRRYQGQGGMRVASR